MAMAIQQIHARSDLGVAVHDIGRALHIRPGRSDGNYGKLTLT